MEAEDIHARISTQQMKKDKQDLQKIKKSLKHLAGGCIIKATLRAEIAKGTPPP
jgi:hypothetical protein